MIRILFILLLFLAVATGILAFLVSDDVPVVADGQTLSHESVARAKRILAGNDPRRFQEGRRHTLSVSEDELNLVTGYLAERSGHGHAATSLVAQAIHLDASIAVPENPLGGYINLHLQLEVGNGEFSIGKLTAGGLYVPPVLSDWIFKQLIRWWLPARDYAMLAASFQSVSIQDKHLQLHFIWSKTLANGMRERLISRQDQQRLQTYHQALVTILDARGEVRSITLAELLHELFAVAARHSRHGHAVAENRALCIVVAIYLNGNSLATLAPATATDPMPREVRVTLGRRVDFAKHFMISAALAAASDSRVADAVGIYKEVSDIAGGSGFSFTDLAADRAGTRFGQLATESEVAARYTQQQLLAGAVEDTFMPSVKGLPEFMRHAQFSQQYGRVGSPAYNALMADIQSRVEACPLYVSAP